MSKKLLIAATLMACHILSTNVPADTIRIDTLVALDLSESEARDRIRIEYIVDGGKMQAVRRVMSHGDVWNVGLDITFAQEVTIQLYEKEKWIKRDKKLGAVTLRPGSIGVGNAKVFNFTGHGAHYWMSIGSGNYVAPQPPTASPKPVKTRWEYWGGVYETAAAATAAGERLVEMGVATKFQVYDYVNLKTYTVEWAVKYLPK